MSGFTLGHYFCCQKGQTLVKRDSLSATAESWCVLPELDKGSHHPKALHAANNINKVHSAALSTPLCFQQFSSLMYIFIMAHIGVWLYSSLILTFSIPSFCDKEEILPSLHIAIQWQELMDQIIREQSLSYITAGLSGESGLRKFPVAVLPLPA